MSKHHVIRPIRHDGETFSEGVVELDDVFAAPLHQSGHLKPAADDAEVTPAKKAASKKAGK